MCGSLCIHICGAKFGPCMVDNSLAFGIFPQIMVRALIIMMVRDDLLDHTLPF